MDLVHDLGRNLVHPMGVRACELISSNSACSSSLTADFSTWLEVPEYSMLTAELTPAGLAFETRDLDV